MTEAETTQLIRRLQLLQSQLCEMANDLGNLTDPEIVAVSEEADRLIVQLQRLRKEESDSRKLNKVSISSASQSPEEIGKERRALVLKNS